MQLKLLMFTLHVCDFLQLLVIMVVSRGNDWDYIVVSIGLSCLWLQLLQEKDLSHELLQTTSPLMKLSDCHASKMENFQQHDDSINAIRRLAIDKKDTSNDRNRLTKWCEKSGQ